MKSKTKVIIIGGGVVGVSTLYHLAKKEREMKPINDHQRRGNQRMEKREREKSLWPPPPAR